MSPTERVGDLVGSVRAYAVQETIGPARGAARWLAYGSLGALFTGLGIVLLALGVLRMVQDLGGSALAGGWSFVPHLSSAGVLSALSVVALRRAGKSTLGRKP
jgi:hypothetical protein